MSLPEHSASAASPTAPDPSNLEALEAAFRSLRNLFNFVVLTMILLSASIFIYMLRQVSSVRRQTTELTQFVSDYQRNQLPAVEEFGRKLQAFTQTNRDFVAIYMRYFSSNTAPARSPGGPIGQSPSAPPSPAGSPGTN
jgi:hypothetical protein